MCRILEHLIPDLAAAVNKDLGGYEVRVGCGRFGLRSTYKHCRLKIGELPFSLIPYWDHLLQFRLRHGILTCLRRIERIIICIDQPGLE